MKTTLDLFTTPPSRTINPPDPLFDEAEIFTISVEDIDVKVFRWNKGGTKKLVIVHGFESAASNFGSYITKFIQKGYEVLAVDAPGHGLSGGKQLSLLLYIKTIEVTDKEFGPIESFVTHSFGGLALAHYLETQADNASKRIALIAPATELTTAADNFFSYLKLNGSLRKEFNAYIQEITTLPMSFYSIPRAMKQIQSKILWIHDEEDSITPLKDVAPVMEKNYPNVKFIVTKGLGHSRIYRDQEVIDAVVEFL